MDEFVIMTVTQPGHPDPALAIAGCRAGAVGILNLEYTEDVNEARDNLQRLANFSHADFGIKVSGANLEFLQTVTAQPPPQLRYVILSLDHSHNLKQSLNIFANQGLAVLLECTCLEEALEAEKHRLFAVIAKGHEAGGRIGPETTFILLQRLVKQLSLPVYVQGGIGLHTAPACYAAGAVGVVLDAQLALTRESPLPAAIKNQIKNMDGTETIILGEEIGRVHRVLSRFGAPVIRELQEIEQNCHSQDERPEKLLIWQQKLASHIGWQSREHHLFPWGQDIALAHPLAQKFVTVGGLVQALRQSIADHGRAACLSRPLAAGSPLAQRHGTRFPIVQGPMARVSDTPAFALEVANEGALPFIAAAWMRGPELQQLLEETAARLGGRAWGVGLLGFLDPDHYREQITAVLGRRPPFALIAGGHPEQVKALEQEGIACYVHVPSVGLLRMFLDRGIRRFVFEGRESGGHIGPLSSFVLWEGVIEQLLGSTEAPSQAQECQVLFAGGIHDSLSAAMVALMAAPLAAKGFEIGVQMGSAYLFTEEAVATGALAPAYQQEARRSHKTTVLTSGPGHAERCLETPFAQAFQKARQRLRLEGAPAEVQRQTLEHMKIGRLRIAAKGTARNPAYLNDPRQPKLLPLSGQEQHEQGIYLIGQLAALRDRSVTIATLHHDIAVEGTRRLAALHPLALEVQEQEEKPSDVAVIGMACLLPQAGSPSAYWENILNKVNTLREIPPDRWDWRLYYDADQRARDKICSKWGAFLDDLPFDPTRYGITPNSLPAIESLQLLALEVTRRALEDAGYAHRPFNRSRTSVILGISGSGELAQLYSFRTALPTFFGDGAGELVRRFEEVLPEWTEDAFPGILMNVAAGRLANRFDLGGLNCTVDAACASSLAAVYLAVRELEARTSDVVVVGGGDCMQNPFTYMCFSKTQALSNSDQSHALDEEANGIALGEGVVVMILKRLADAERDGDKIYAVIKGVAASSDGRGKSLTAPSREGQVRVLDRAYRKAGFSPATVGLLEAHATGTTVGDRTEIEALSQVWREAGAGEQTCAIGSVKSMIGHTKAAAGLASLMKTVLALHHKVLPPTLGVKKPNPALCLPGTPLYANTESRPWIGSDQAKPRRAGVSAFGFGGTNFHVVLEEYCGDYLDHLIEAPRQQGPGELLLWKGSRLELLDSLKFLQEALQQEPPFSLADLAFSLASRFEHPGPRESEGGLRLAVVAASLDDLRRKLAQAWEALQGSQSTLADPRGVYFTEHPLGVEGKLAFLFPGQGSQYVDMFADLAVQFPEFRKQFEKADRLLAARLPRPLSSFIFPPPAYSEAGQRDRQQALVQTTVAQPALGAANLAMFNFLTELGGVPAMVAGHSYGEYVALAAAGVFGEDDLLRLSEARARFILEEAPTDPGAMAAVGADVQKVRQGLAGLAGVWIANINAPAQTVIAGGQEAVAEALQRLQARGLQARLLPVGCAFHSPLVEPAGRRLEEFLGALTINPAKIKVFSNTTAAPYPKKPQAIVRQLVEHMVKRVQFVREIEAMYADGARIFVEVGPGRVLSGLVSQILGARPHLALPSNQAGASGPLQLLHLLGQLLVHRVAIKVDRLYQGRSVRPIDLNNLGKEAKAEPLSPTTWLVNGARAKPLKETTASRRPAVAVAGPPYPVAAATPTDHGTAPDLAGVNHARAARPAGGIPALPPLAATDSREDVDQVMLQYQRLSQLFLETQKQVMTSYLEASGGRLPGLEPALKPVIAAPAVSRMAAEAAAGALDPHEVSLAEQTSPAAAAAEIAQAQAITATPGAPLEMNRQALTEGLLKIVGERTGYPREMLDLNLDLEADLGIDSIKRLEILGHFIQGLFPPEADGPPEELGELGGVRTLGEIIDRAAACLENPSPKHSVAAPPTGPTMGSASPIQPEAPEPLPRFTLVAIPAPEPTPSLRLAPGRLVIITDDGRGIAAALQQKLQQRGLKTALIRLGGREAAGAESSSFTAGSPASLPHLVEKIRREQGAIGGLVHLLPLRACISFEQFELKSWQERLQEDVGSLYLILHAAAAEFKEAAAAGGAWVVSASGLGGLWGRELSKSMDFFPGHGGIPGLLKTLAMEWPEVRVKSVDLLLEEPAAQLADHLLTEIEAGDDLVEVGYRQRRRLTLGLREMPLTARQDNGLKIDSASVILVTGGARGITAAVTLELARQYRPILLVAGRTPVPAAAEEVETAGLTQPQELKAALIAQQQRRGQDIKLPEVEAAYQKLLKEREMRANLAALRTAGAQVSIFSGGCPRPGLRRPPGSDL